jgi:hypothetical protein
MGKEDIIAGLKQAVARGDSLERAKISFINAGYSRKDVEDSVYSVQNSVSSLTSSLPESKITNTSISQIPSPNKNPKEINQNKQLSYGVLPIPSNLSNQSNNMQQKPKGKKGKILVFVVIILLVLLGASFFYLRRGA